MVTVKPYLYRMTVDPNVVGRMLHRRSGVDEMMFFFEDCQTSWIIRVPCNIYTHEHRPPEPERLGHTNIRTVSHTNHKNPNRTRATQQSIVLPPYQLYQSHAHCKPISCALPFIIRVWVKTNEQHGPNTTRGCLKSYTNIPPHPSIKWWQTILRLRIEILFSSAKWFCFVVLKLFVHWSDSAVA